MAALPQSSGQRLGPRRGLRLRCRAPESKSAEFLVLFLVVALALGFLVDITLSWDESANPRPSGSTGHPRASEASASLIESTEAYPSQQPAAAHAADEHLLQQQQQKNDGISNGSSSSSLGAEFGRETAAEIRFLHWLHEHGAREVLPEHAKLRIIRPLGADGEEGERGMGAARDIAEGEVVVSVPFSAALTLDDYKDVEPFPGASDYLRLIAKLLGEMAKGNSSRWSPFLSILPRHLPIPWLSIPEPDLPRHVQLPTTLRRLRALLRFFRSSYHRCLAAPGSVKIRNATYRQFVWGWAMHFTRHFSLLLPTRQGESQGQRLTMLLPFGDLMNQRFRGEWDEGDVEWEEEVHFDRVELLAQRPIKAGQQVYEIYLNAPTEVYYMFQGFVPDYNPHNTIVLFESVDEAVAWLLAHLDERGLLGRAEGGVDQTTGAKQQGTVPLADDPWLFTRAVQAAHDASAAAMAAVDGQWSEVGFSGTEWFDNENALGDSHSCLEVGRGWAKSRRAMAVAAGVLEFVRREVDRQEKDETAAREEFRGKEDGENVARVSEGKGGVEEKSGGKPEYAGVSEGSRRSSASGWARTAAIDSALGESSWSTYHAQIALVERCKQLLASFPTTIEDDERWLQESTASSATVGAASSEAGEDRVRGKECSTVDGSCSWEFGTEKSNAHETGKAEREGAEELDGVGRGGRVRSREEEEGIKLAVQFRLGQKKMLRSLIQEWEGVQGL